MIQIGDRVRSRCPGRGGLDGLVGTVERKGAWYDWAVRLDDGELISFWSSELVKL